MSSGFVVLSGQWALEKNRWGPWVYQHDQGGTLPFLNSLAVSTNWGKTYDQWGILVFLFSFDICLEYNQVQNHAKSTQISDSEANAAAAAAAASLEDSPRQKSGSPAVRPAPQCVQM